MSTTDRRCGAMQPTPTAMTDYITCYCSLPVGHQGGHRSLAASGQIIGIWRADPPPLVCALATACAVEHPFIPGALCRVVGDHDLHDYDGVDPWTPPTNTKD